MLIWGGYDPFKEKQVGRGWVPALIWGGYDLFKEKQVRRLRKIVFCRGLFK